MKIEIVSSREHGPTMTLASESEAEYEALSALVLPMPGFVARAIRYESVSGMHAVVDVRLEQSEQAQRAAAAEREQEAREREALALLRSRGWCCARRMCSGRA